KIIIISDCSHVLYDIKHFNIKGSPHPAIISQIYNLLHSPQNHNIILKWMNANTEAVPILFTDILAKEAALLHEITAIDYTSDEALLLVENWMWNNWKTYW